MHKHGIRTERGLTPNQLFVSGSLQLRNSGLTALDYFDMVPETYGVDSGNVGVPSNSDDDDDGDGVAIPPIEVDFSDDQIAELQSTIHLLTHSDEFGVDLYTQALDMLQQS